MKYNTVSIHCTKIHDMKRNSSEKLKYNGDIYHFLLVHLLRVVSKKQAKVNNVPLHLFLHFLSLYTNVIPSDSVITII